MADDFVICVRKKRRDAFVAEPGPARYLAVPAGEEPAPRHAMARGEWVKRVRGAAVHTTDPSGREQAGDMLIFVHGYNNGPVIIMQRHRRLARDLAAAGYRGAVVSFDWPSAESTLNYLEDRTDAKQTALHLVEDGILLFARHQQRDCSINAHVLAHSTGAYVVREAFDDADDRSAISTTNWTASQVVFIGGDVSSRSLAADSAKSSSLFRHSVRITNYSNPYDAVLKLSNIKRIGAAPRVGRIGLPAGAPPTCVDVDCGRHYTSLDEMRATFFGTFCHSWHIGDPLFARDLKYTLQGDIDRNRIPTRLREDGRLVLIPE